MVARAVSMDRRLLDAARTEAMNPGLGREPKPDPHAVFQPAADRSLLWCTIGSDQGVYPQRFLPCFRKITKYPSTEDTKSDCYPQESKLVFRPTQEEDLTGRPHLTSSRGEDGGRFCSGIDKKTQPSDLLDHQLFML